MKKKWKILLGIAILLIIARLLLPYFLEKYVNKTLNDIPGYEGGVSDIDVALYRGAYVIEDLWLDKENATLDAPLLNFPKSDISIEWKSLFKGRIVSEIVLHSPEMNYIFEDQKKTTPEGKPDVGDWTDALTDLVPIKINHLEAHDGKINFVQFSADPNIDLVFDDIFLYATNLQNVRRTDTILPSTINATATSFGGGKASLDGRINVMKKIPDMDVEFALKKADVTALNEMSINAVGVDFASGTFELYSEMAIADGYLKGYLKPMFINTELIGEEDQGFFEKIWEGFVGVFKFLFKNQGTDTLATKAPLEGDLNNIDTGVLSTILNIFKNAWISAFTTDVDEDINYQEAVKESKEGD
ncbi:DUF748 domain-containing protein [Salinimicrobium catena]|uniref:DUF748 domain-containing protein n=1 Tax=Salinimicrobium catena TaxID=390640 RepID=UPI002FE4EACE